MLSLIIHVCLIGEPTQCKDVELAYVDDMTPMQCMMGAQPEIAKWVEGHPKWQIKKWTCKPQEKVEKNI